MAVSPVDKPRRAFLRAAGGAGLLGALAGARAPAATSAPAPAAPAAKAGYRETDHIRTYYRSARYW